MKKIKIIFFLFLINVSCEESELIQGNLVFFKDTIAIDKIKIGDTIRKTFVCKNNGESPIKILNVGSSCGCTVARFDTFSLKKNAEAKVDVVYKNLGDTGRLTKVIVVETNGLKKLVPIYLKIN
jgi:hypothetical protein